jgi:sugar O-acyltransferase (sialic acid O-acetyltransferase NeuD family)
MRRTLFIYGAGALGIEVSFLVGEKFLSRLKYRKVFFIDDDFEAQKVLTGKSVLTKEDFLKLGHDKFDFVVAIANPSERERIAVEMETLGGTPINVLSAKRFKVGSMKIGRGNIIFPGNTISNAVSIRNYVIINSNSYIGHDCEIASYVTISPGVIICGNVKIQDGVFVGAGAVIKQGKRGRKTTLSSNALIGLGSVVLNDVDPGVTVMGNPAKQRTKINS